jgi:hypothetical protein
MINRCIKNIKTQKLSCSLELFIVVAVFGLIFMIAIVQPLDGDTWWHLRAGEETFKEGKPLIVDVFSYTRQGQDWAAHGWMTELWLYSLYRVGGFTAITVWIALMTIMIITLMYFQMEGPPILKICLLVVVSIMLLPFLKARPQMTSLVFVLLTTWILHLYRTQKRDLVLWLIPIFILWANLHGGFIAGFIVILINIIGDLIGRVMHETGARHLDRNQVVKLLVVLVACAVAVMIHPLGINVWTTLYHTMMVGGDRALIVEWASPDFHDPILQLYLWFLLCVLVIFAIAPRKVAWIELMIFSAFTAMGFIWRRNLSLMVVYGMVVTSFYLWSFLSVFWEKTKSDFNGLTKKLIIRIKSGLESNTPVGIHILLCVITAFVYLGGVYKINKVTNLDAMAVWENQLFPVKAKDWIENNHPAGNMLNSYNWGGYFEWYLRDYPVFLDSRADLFGNEIIYQWLDVMDAKDNWQEILDRWNVKFLVIEPSWRIVDIAQHNGWKELYRDNQSVIFGRDKN